MYPIVACETFSDMTFLWEVHAPDVAQAAQPGHFVMIRLYEGGERIPLTVADYDREQGHRHHRRPGARQDDARDARQIPARATASTDFVGPAGPAAARREGRPRGAGRRRPRRGAGVPAAPRLQGGRATAPPAIMGFRTKDLVFWEDKFRAVLATSSIVCTDDGSYGKPGFVTARFARRSSRRTSPIWWSPSAPCR